MGCKDDKMVYLLAGNQCKMFTLNWVRDAQRVPVILETVPCHELTNNCVPFLVVQDSITYFEHQSKMFTLDSVLGDRRVRVIL
jgi:hypothetical protein